jgi:hypothetical protein
MVDEALDCNKSIDYAKYSYSILVVTIAGAEHGLPFFSRCLPQPVVGLAVVKLCKIIGIQ